jgi:hypothetical protein
MTVIKQFTGVDWETIAVGATGPTGPTGPAGTIVADDDQNIIANQVFG